MEGGMLLALEKAFLSDDPAVQSLKSHTYGRLHRILAGCYFQTGRPGRFMWHLMKSLRYDFRNIRYFAAWPKRLFSRVLSR